MEIDLGLMRERILDVAEQHFRRIGYQKTSMADIAACLRMSSANIYRYFPSRAEIDAAICGRFIERTTRSADAVARQKAPAHEKIEGLLKLLHEERQKTFIQEKRVYDLIVAATMENWPVIRAHNDRLTTIIAEIIQEGAEGGTFFVDDAATAARSAMNAFMPFYHPVFVANKVRNTEETGQLHEEQICFILKALGWSDQRICLSVLPPQMRRKTSLPAT
ncbi:TetR/AcrR family transcriptional regulator [Neorhizobium lilium]|uniref:TetR/AcrR family transcriptional regulator n=1 Tax=Neorhizobium lilium TaxID=2503024 RepID=A0A3S3RY50_9HYPH|nr:TetR/AcrR family transcriptional regulator [Neorhizobium lilium]RWX81303.1 TetR/AcrR family transcriptional regulator [Neorhizobium lilium]